MKFTLLIKRIFKSIALLPSVIALIFLILGIGINLIEYDYSQIEFLKALLIEDREKIQHILAYVIGGIFTLTIFSFTMVMNVINSNINLFSPRLVPLLLSEQHHKIVLGFTTGTIVYAMVLSIRASGYEEGYFSGIATALAVCFAITCVFLYIYFLHHISISIHINFILHKSFSRTQKNIEKYKALTSDFGLKRDMIECRYEILSGHCGYIQMHKVEECLELIEKLDTNVVFVKYPGEFVLENDVILKSSKELSADNIKELIKHIPIDKDVPMNVVETGFKHLVEVAVKASSPAINDPGTALSAIHYLTQLFIKRHFVSQEGVFSANEKHLLGSSILSNKMLFKICYQEMINYMTNDPVLVRALKHSSDKINHHTTTGDYIVPS
ncbi:hypothetical protein GCM10009117_12840 [Gangjinia marincola]|uniref:DUF2254 domain-containing protein n=1 Tax=Gangjinia marincola TaxID=578463 RepID=A0ABN1MG44_9FLAO